MESAAQVELRLPEIRTADLSPVAESPTNKSPVGVSPVSYPKIKKRLSDHMVKGMASPNQLVFEPRRKAEIEHDRKRRNQARDHAPQPVDYNITANVSVTDVTSAQHESHYPFEARTPIATRRGKGVAPALDLDGELKKKKEQKWRVVPENEMQAMKSPPASWQPMLTPQRIGEDLFIGVEKY